jgi:hypothetical protein
MLILRKYNTVNKWVDKVHSLRSRQIDKWAKRNLQREAVRRHLMAFNIKLFHSVYVIWRESFTEGITSTRKKFQYRLMLFRYTNLFKRIIASLLKVLSWTRWWILALIIQSSIRVRLKWRKLHNKTYHHHPITLKLIPHSPISYSNHSQELAKQLN